jgi:FkbM family methyltransferase
MAGVPADSPRSRLRGALTRLLAEDDKLSFVAARVLWASGLCRLITFALPDGYRMRFYPSAVSTSCWLDRQFRPADSTVVRRLLRPGATFVDVGANVGSLSLLAWTRVRPRGRVMAIEPHPRTYRFLVGNVALNGFAIETYNLAVGAEPCELSFTSLRSDDQNRATPAPPGGGDVRVAVTTLDRLVGDADVDLLKIDTEGFELRVLAGATATLRRCAAIYIEDSDRNLRRYGGSSAELRETLCDAGFVPFRIEGDRAVPVGPDGDDRAARGAVNLVALRRGAVDALLRRSALTRTA